LGFGSAAAIHVLAEAMRHAYRDRNNELGDPAFVQNPLQRLLSAEYAESIRKAIPPEQATPSKDLPAESPPAQEKSETTHYSIMDKQGNAVAVTYTLNGGFGAGVIAPGTGFFLNDEMDDFTVKPGTPNMFGLVQGTVNAIAPGKRPLSSMTPTIVTKDGKVAFVLGSPGGSRITTAVLLTLVDLIDFGMRPEEAVDAPRIHQQWLPDTVFAERFAISPDTRKILESDGYSITDAQPGSDVELIVVGPESPAASTGAGNGADTALSGALMPGLLYGASDDRRPAGAAVGY
jgi:gamma-glutamyltranspeptidase/glutathione hydrolase